MLKLTRLREARELAGFSQDELAKTSGVARATVADLELGKRTAQPRTARRLAEALGLEIRELLEEPEPAVPLAQAPPESPEIQAGEAGRLAVNEDRNRLFGTCASYLWDDVYWLRDRIGIDPGLDGVSDWTEEVEALLEADPVWLGEEVVPRFEQHLFVGKAHGVFSLMDPYVVALVEWETAGKNLADAPFPDDFRQNVVALFHALEETKLYLEAARKLAERDRSAFLEMVEGRPRESRVDTRVT